MMLRCRIVLPCVLLLSMMLPVQCFADDMFRQMQDRLESRCSSFKNVQIPQADIGVAPKDCHSEDLYYGSDGKAGSANYVAARQCAYRERSAGELLRSDGKLDVFAGSGILMMIYANGQGVKRNIALAKRFACEYDSSLMELEYRLQHLDAIASGKDARPIDVCDDITSGLMEGFCAGRDNDFAQRAREKQWSALQSTWNATQRTALANLRKTAHVYFDNVARNEIDLSGTARGMFSSNAYEVLDKNLFTETKKLERSKHPPAKGQDFAQADKALNMKYRNIMAALQAAAVKAKSQGFNDFGTIKADGVRSTQRSWLSYREAWVNLGAARYPNVPADAWRAWLTRERTQTLNCITSADKTCPGYN